MKNIFKITILSVLIFYSCSNDSLKENPQPENIVNQNSENLYSKVSKENLYTEVVNNNLSIVNKFSKTIADLNLVQSISITNINSNNIEFKANSKLLILNTVNTYISSRNFKITKNGDVYILEDNTQDFKLSLDTNKLIYYVEYNQNLVTLSSLLNQQIDAEMERNIPLYLYLIDEFTKKNIDRGFTAATVAKRKYEGTGVGFHTNLADAHQFCQEDYQQILDGNPGWWSPGISYSCAWDENLCVCTANFYTTTP